MIRSVIQLKEEQARALKRLAAERGVSVAALVREAVDEVLSRAASRWKRALSIPTFASGRSDVSGQHDRYLGEDRW
ncbi:MAG: ribbon-helix-helix protein, CopG family [Acidobacteria bacterium]|nr:ribbon-helix-helix protein, CopG family [Acidobacteriota bacterium]